MIWPWEKSKIKISQLEEQIEVLQKDSEANKRRIAESSYLFSGDINQSTFNEDKNQNSDILKADYWTLQKQCYDIAKINPYAKRVIEMITDFVIGSKLTYSIVEKYRDKVKPVLDAFWNDYDNNFDMSLEGIINEWLILGEQIFPFSVDPITKVLKLGIVDARAVDMVLRDPVNSKRMSQVVLQADTLGNQKFYSIMGEAGGKLGILDRQKNIPSDMSIFGAKYAGDVFMFQINRLPTQTRGYSELTTMVESLDLLDQFIFQATERSLLLYQFIADVELKNMDEDSIKNYPIPDPTKNRVFKHNQNVSLNLRTPDLKAVDADKFVRMIVRYILAGVGIPEHFIVNGENTNLACHDMQTETLTERGWLHYDDVKDTDRIGTYNQKTGMLEFHNFTDRYVYDYDGEMVRFKNKRIDMMVTPNHRMFLCRGGYADDKDNLSKYEIIKAENVTKNSWWIPVSADWDGREIETFTLPEVSTGIGRAIYPEVTFPMDEWLEFLGYFISEGHARSKTGEYVVKLYQKKPHGVLKIKNRLDSMPFPFWESINDEGVKCWTVNDKALNLWLRKNCGDLAAQKQLPDFVDGLSRRQLSILFEALMLGDGSKDSRDGRTSMYYSTSSKKLAEQVQILTLKLGFQARVCKMTNGPTSKAPGLSMYRVQINTRSKAKFGVDAIKRENYKGRVYCFEVPNHLFITRRNGKIAVSHNTAREQNNPIEKRFLRKQGTIGNMLKTLFRYQLEVKFPNETSTEIQDMLNGITIEFPPVSGVDMQARAITLTEVAKSLVIAVNQGWVVGADAGEEFVKTANQFGMDLSTTLFDGEQKNVLGKLTGKNIATGNDILAYINQIDQMTKSTVSTQQGGVANAK